MNTLRLEELEQRDLLSGGYFGPPMRGPQSMGGFRESPFGMERPTMNDIGGPRQVEMSGAMNNGPAWTMAAQSDPTFEAPAVEVVEVIIIVRTPDHDTTVTVGGSNTPAISTSGGDMTASAGMPKTPVKTPDTYVTPTDAPAVHAAAVVANRITPTTTPFMLVPATNAFSGDVQGPVAAQVLNRPINLADSFAARTGAMGPLLTPGNSGTAAPPQTVEVASPVEPPAPAAPPVVSTLDAVDLSALGRELGHFLQRIERVGEELVGDGEGLRPWIVAGAAAATAAEIARRQFKRAAELAAEAEVHPPELFVG
jgi:hypothetical protein